MKLVPNMPIKTYLINIYNIANSESTPILRNIPHTNLYIAHTHKVNKKEYYEITKYKSFACRENHETYRTISWNLQVWINSPDCQNKWADSMRLLDLNGVGGILPNGWLTITVDGNCCCGVDAANWIAIITGSDTKLSKKSDVSM